MRAQLFLCAASAALAATIMPDPLAHIVHQKVMTTSQRAPGAPRVAVDNFVYLDNGIVSIGIDVSRGGSVGSFGPSGSGSPNYINIHDFGRETQVSYYTGPVPYNVTGCNQPASYAGFPYNPIGAGDYYGNPAQLLSVVLNADNTSATVTSIPAQWACNRTPAEGVLVKRISLVGNAAEVATSLQLDRPDKSFYGVFSQELPAVYVTGALCELWSYVGDAPYTNDTATQFIAPPPTDGISLRAPEQWIAFMLPGTSAGVGLWHPSTTVMAAMRWNSSFNGCVGGPYDDVTGYISGRFNEVLDWNIDYQYNYSLIYGSLNDIRGYAQQKKEAGLAQPGPKYVFANDRQHFTWANCNASAWPVNGFVQLLMEVDDPNFVSGFAWWRAADVPTLYVTAAYSPQQHDTEAQLFFLTSDMNNGFDADHVVTFSIVDDGAKHTYAVPLSSSGNYTGTINQVRFDPVISGQQGATVTIYCITDDANGCE
jgi:hypothetical protein